MQRAIETASRFKVTGLIANSHLIDETSPEVVLEGWRMARSVSEECGLPVRFVAVLERLASAPELAEIDVPLLALERHMLPPWRRREAGQDDAPGARETLPAARPVPLGKPGPITFDKR
ncbi:MAG: hypothetical protein OEQ13_10945, partial [Acidobacteriota bacterium]|nr:hypothetical protein [Acidobacteriota bacterium]